MSNQLLNSLKTLSEPLKTSYGPNGTDTLIVSGKNSTITNDGATIMSLLEERSVKNVQKNQEKNDFFSQATIHPALTFLINLSKAQDDTSGDGTTSVVLLAGALADKANDVLSLEYHPNLVAECLEFIRKEAKISIQNFSIPIFKEISDFKKFKNLRDFNEIKKSEFYGIFFNSVKTSLSSKILYSVIDEVAPVAIEAVMRAKGDVSNIHIKKMNGSMENICVIDGIVIENASEFAVKKISAQKNLSNIGKLSINTNGNIAINENISSEGNISINENIADQNTKIDQKIIDDQIDQIEKNTKSIKIEKNVVKVAMCQFSIIPPKLNLDTNITINDASLIEDLVRDEKNYIRQMCKKIYESGAEILIVQKSIIKEPVSNLSRHYLKKLGIHVEIIDRQDFEKIANQLDLKISTRSDSISCNNLEILVKESGIEKIASLKSLDPELQTVTVLVSASDAHIIDEAERSLHDAMCVVRCLLDEPFVCYGGGNFEIKFAEHLRKKYYDVISKIKKDPSINADCAKYPFLPILADAFEMLPFYLAQNAGMDFKIVAEIRNAIKEQTNLGIIPNSAEDYKNFLEKISKINQDDKDKMTGELRYKCFVQEVGHVFDASKVVQPAKVARSMVELACECVSMVVRINEVLPAHR